MIYFALGPRALSDSPMLESSRLATDFFFSVQTFGTIGFGHVYPATTAANLAVTLEAFVGLVAVALLTGMLFARFSQANHRVLFSDHAVIAPYQGGRALMFRMVNGRRSELIDVSVEVVLTLRQDEWDETGNRANPSLNNAEHTQHRQFVPLALERSQVTLFPLAWTVVHPCDPESLFTRLNAAELAAHDAEVIVIFRATDEVSQQPVQARVSYHSSEILWERRFVPMYVRTGRQLAVDARLLHTTEALPEPPAAPNAS
ncbi:ion channel [Deinococcus sp.]|uniref:ion channel n=1 Tax=Deinococcus sp. TaxID=47478 RepID=UPI00345D2717